MPRDVPDSKGTCTNWSRHALNISHEAWAVETFPKILAHLSKMTSWDKGNRAMQNQLKRKGAGKQI